LQPLQDKSAPQTLFTTSLAKELLKVPERPESLSEAIAVKQKNNKQQKSESESSNNGYKKSEKEKQKAFCNSVIKVLKTSNASDEPVSFTAIRLFPILGGRLLKVKRSRVRGWQGNVSNPWREAIEENISDHKISYELLYSLTKEVYHKSVLVSSFHLSHCNMFL